MKKTLSILLAIVMLLSLFAGCGGGKGTTEPPAGGNEQTTPSGGGADSSGETSSPQDAVSAKDTIVIGSEAEPASIGPTGSSGEQTIRIRRLVCEGMFEMNDAGEYEPKLATSWEWRDDVTLVFHLREGVKFSDGTDFTADDVIFTINTQMETGTSSLLSQYVDTMEAEDDYTLVIHFNQPNALCFNQFSTKWLPVISPEAYAADENQMNYHVVGTGPYLMEKWVTGESLTLTRNDDYWGEPAKIKNVEFRFIVENSQRTIEMETGGIDIDCSVDVSDTDYFDSADYQISYNPGVFLRELFFNLSRTSPIADVRVRQAIAYAFDVEALCETYMSGTTHALTTNISPVYASVYEEGSELLYGYNLDRAKELLAEAGYPDGGFKLALLCNGSMQDDTDQAEILQAALAPLGIEVELVIRDSMTWYSTCVAKEEWDMCWFSLGDESPIFAWMHFLGDTEHFGMPDYTNYRNDEFTQALSELSHTNDVARQKELFATMNRCVTEDLPLYSLYNPTVISVCTSSLKNVEYRSGTYNVEQMYFQ